MDKRILILLGIIIFGLVAFNDQLPFSFLQGGRTINVEYGSNIEIWNTMINDRPEPVYCEINLYKDGRMFQQGQKYLSIESYGEMEYQLYDYCLDKDTVYDVKYVLRDQLSGQEKVLESGSIRYTVNVNSAATSETDIPMPYVPPVNIEDEVEIPDEPVYDPTIQAVITNTPPSPLSSGNYEVLIDDLSTGNITYWKLYQDDKIIYQGSESFRSFRAYIDAGSTSIFMVEISNSGRVSTAYLVVDTAKTPEPPIIYDFGMVASITSDNIQPLQDGLYTVDIWDNSSGNIDTWILYENDYEIYRGSSSFGTRKQIIPSGQVTIYMIEIQNEKAVATSYTVVDTTSVDIPAFSLSGSSQYSNMYLLGGIALFIIWAFAGFKRPF